jgi:hypothetical protein
MQHLLPKLSSPTKFASAVLHAITSEKIISHHIPAFISSGEFFRDNLSKIFTSCLIKAYEIRASSGKRHLQTA